MSIHPMAKSSVYHTEIYIVIPWNWFHLRRLQWGFDEELLLATMAVDFPFANE